MKLSSAAVPASTAASSGSAQQVQRTAQAWPAQPGRAEWHEPVLGERWEAATPRLLERHRAGRGFDWAAAPLVRFNDKDDSQQRILERHGVTGAPPTHEVPDGGGFVTAVRSGLGWGALLTAQLAPLLESGALVRLGSRDHVDVPLYWQRWRLPSAHLDRLSAVVRSASAHDGNRPARGGSSASRGGSRF